MRGTCLEPMRWSLVRALLLLVLALVCQRCSATIAYVSNGSTASYNGTQTVTFLDALNDTAVTTMVLVTDVTLSSAAVAPYGDGTPFKLRRNLTITSANQDLQNYSILEFSFLTNVIMLGPDVTVEFHNVTISRAR